MSVLGGDLRLGGHAAELPLGQLAHRAKDDLLARLAHELLSPLQVMVGWLSLLRAGTPDAAMQERALGVIERNLKAQAVLLYDLLDVSRIVTDKLTIEPSAVDLATIVRSAVEDHRPAADAQRVALEGPSQAESVIVHGDANRLAQVVANLLTNAVKFTPEGGIVRVALVAESVRVVLEVRDTGQGIAPELLPHVFDHLRQGNPRTGRGRGGLGLGLAIAKHLVEQHGGSITAESEGHGSGALFRVTLPRGGPLAMSSPPPLQPAGQEQDQKDHYDDSTEAVSVVHDVISLPSRAARSVPNSLASGGRRRRGVIPPPATGS